MSRFLSIALVAFSVGFFGVPSAGAAPNTVVLANCLFKPEVKPSSVIFACGDGGVYATGVRWSNWGAPFAIATATMHANDCEPNCAAGHFHVYAAYLAVTGRVRCANGEPAYAKVAYVARTRGVPNAHSRLDWFDRACH